jgi:PAS domain S-box-containing protein
MKPNSHWLIRYGGALVAVGAALLLRLALMAWVGPGLPTYITFYPAVMVVALLGGLGPGLLATAAVVLAADYWIIPPQGLRIERFVDGVGLAFFASMGVFMSIVAELYRRTRLKAAAYDKDLALRESRQQNEMLARVIEHSSQPFGMGYADGRLGLINRAFERLTGYSGEELRTRDWTKTLTPPEWRESERLKLEELLKTGQPVRYEKEYIRKDGARVPIELLVHLARDAEGKPEYYYSFVTDITERKRAEEALQESERQFRTLAESIPNLAWWANSDGYIAWYNQRWHEYTGTTPQEMEGWGWQSVHDPQALPAVLERWKASLATGEPFEMTFPLRGADGVFRPFLTRVLPLKDAQGRVQQWFGTNTDVSEQLRTQETERRLNAELRQRVAELQAANKEVQNSRRSAVSLAEDAIEAHKEAEKANAALQKLNRTLKALSDSSKSMLRATSEKMYLDEVCKDVVANCGHAMVWVGFAEEDEDWSVRPVAYAGFEEGYLESLHITWADCERGRGPTGTAIRTGKPCACSNMLTDPAFAPWREEAIKRGYASSLVLPLMSGGKAFGAITIYSRHADPFTEDETRLLVQLADDVGYCIRSLRALAERNRAEEQLRLLSTAVESAVNGIAITDRQGRLLWINPAFTQLTGYSMNEAVGQNPRLLKSGQHTPAFYREMWGTILRGEPWRGELVNRRKDGSLYFEEMTITPVRAGGADITHFVAIKQDVTRRKEAEEALQRLNEELEERVAERTVKLSQSGARYRSLVTATAQIVWTTNPDGQIVTELPTWQEFTGQSYAEYQGSGWSNALHPDDREPTKAVWLGAVAARTLYEIEYRMRRRDGQYRHILARGVPVLEADGSIREWVGTCTDITERKEAERRREFTAALLGLFVRKSSANDYLDSVVDIIRQWSGCQALGIRLKNEQQEIPYESWAGFEPGFLELEQRLSLEHDSCLCIRAISGKFEEPDRPLLTRGGSFRADDAIAFAKGLAPEKLARYRGNCMKFGFTSLAVIPIRYREEIIGAIHLADRRPGQFPLEIVEVIELATPLIGEALHRFRTEAELAKHRDHLEVLVRQRTNELETANTRLQVEIAERQRAQEALEHAAADLKRSNSDLEQFAYVASHDLQEPLRAVGGYVKLLQRRFPENVDAKAKEFITGASEGATRMERLITDLLAFSRVGTRGRAFVPSDLNRVLDDALHNLQATLKSAHATVTHEPLPTLPMDATQMMQLFQNLIGNSIKFHGEQPPQIHVGVRKEEQRWVFQVRDNGIGIEPQYFERIFQIFQRLHTRKHYPGTGIGLAICKKIVERHGGVIWVESQPEQGSTFSFSIPAQAEKPQR